MEICFILPTRNVLLEFKSRLGTRETECCSKQTVGIHYNKTTRIPALLQIGIIFILFHDFMSLAFLIILTNVVQDIQQFSRGDAHS